MSDAERVRDEPAQDPELINQCSGLGSRIIGTGRLPTLKQLVGRYVAEILAATRGNKTKAAAILGMDRRSIYRYIAKLESKA